MMNCYDEIGRAFSEKPTLTRSDLKGYIRTQEPDLKDSTFGWLLYDLCKKCIIQRVSHNAYRVYADGKPLRDYMPNLSDEAGGILGFLRNKFPLLTFVVWETRAYNEFANHQLSRNFIFVEVEKPFNESVFEALREQGTYITLYKPSVKEISLYSGSITVCVLPLTSEAPVSGYHPRLEKLLVDLFANKLLDWIVSRNDYAAIYEEAFSRYNVNYKLMLRYASRRSKEEDIRRFIDSKTSITTVREDNPHDKP